jgi:hypothetical protein
MKKVFSILLLISIHSLCLSQARNVKISESYPLANFIVDSFDYKSAKDFECKWEIGLILIKLDKRNKIADLLFSDSISSGFKNELMRVLLLSNGLWEKKYVKEFGRSQYLLLPVLKAFVSNCKDATISNVTYKGIDSSLEKELDLWKSISVTSSKYLANIVMSWGKILSIRNEDKKHLNCVLLPPCILMDKKPEQLRKL